MMIFQSNHSLYIDCLEFQKLVRIQVQETWTGTSKKRISKWPINTAEVQVKTGRCDTTRTLFCAAGKNVNWYTT